MIRFHVCGSVVLEADGRGALSAVLSQPKQIAVLSYLAIRSGRGFQRRDTLLALFWPELDGEHARAALSKSVHGLRRELGDDVVVSRGDTELGIEAQRLWCDVPAIERALESRNHEAALRLYRGELLEGFHLSRAPEFERWLDRERATWREQMSGCAASLAQAAIAQGKHAAAVRWARRALEIRPYNEEALRLLLVALDQRGDRASALKAYDEFARVVADELETTPAAETSALAERLRRVRPAAGNPVQRGATGAGRPGEARGVALEAAAGAGGESAETIPRPRWKVPALVGAVILLISATGVAVQQTRSADAADRHAIPRLLVLPFEHLGDVADSLFAVGLADEITTKLVGLSGLAIKAQQNAKRLEVGSKSPGEIGRALDVEYVLLGRVHWRRAADGAMKVRVSPRLVEVVTDRQVWADDFEENLEDAHLVQRNIATDVANALGVSLLGRERRAVARRLTNHLGAYEQFLKGSAHLRANWPVVLGLKDAVPFFEKAIELDPAFAAAHARLSITLGGMRWSGRHPIPAETLLHRQRTHAERAMTLDPTLPDAHEAMGLYHYWGMRDYKRALREFTIASAAEPNNSMYLGSQAAIHKRLGNYARAAELAARASELDPLSFSPALEAGYMYAIMRQYDVAQRHLEHYAPLFGSFFAVAWARLARDGDPRALKAWADSALGADGYDLLIAHAAHGYSNPNMGKPVVRVLCGNCDAAIPLVPSVQQQDPQRYRGIALLHDVAGRSTLARAYYDSARALQTRTGGAVFPEYAVLGLKEEAVRAARERVEAMRKARDVFSEAGALLALAETYVLTGDNDAALPLLDWLLGNPSFLSVPLLRVDPLWQPLRRDPRFQLLLERYERRR